MSERVIINLENVASGQELFEAVGERLEFDGSPEHAAAMAPGDGWGRNWNALSDCLADLDVGGVFGTSRKFQFPLTLVITNPEQLQSSEPYAWNTFWEILGDTKAFYAKHGKVFDFVVGEQS